MPSIASLITPDARTWTTGETYTHGKQSADDRNLKTGVLNLNSVIADVEKKYASASAPLGKPQGKLWYDSGTSLLKLYHTALGTPATVLEPTKIYNTSLGTAGTATFKLGGAIDVNTTQVSTTSGAGTDLQKYTIPANVVAANDSCVFVTGFGTRTGSNSVQINGDVGGTSLGPNIDLQTTSTDWFSQIIVVRLTATTQKIFQRVKLNRDDGTQGKRVDYDSGANNLASTTVTGFQISFNASGDTATGEILITRLAQ